MVETSSGGVGERGGAAWEEAVRKPNSQKSYNCNPTNIHSTFVCSCKQDSDIRKKYKEQEVLILVSQYAFNLPIMLICC